MLLERYRPPNQIQTESTRKHPSRAAFIALQNENWRFSEELNASLKLARLPIAVGRVANWLTVEARSLWCLKRSIHWD